MSEMASRELSSCTMSVLFFNFSASHTLDADDILLHYSLLSFSYLQRIESARIYLLF